MPRAKRTLPAPADDNILTDADPLKGLDLPPDPVTPRARRGRRPSAEAGTRIRSTGTTRTSSTAALRASVQQELHIYLELAAGAWAMRDPVCAGVLTEPVPVPTAKGVVTMDRTEAIAARITNILARYPKVMGRLSKTGVIGDFLMIVNLVWPVAVTVMQHHGPGSAGHEGEPDEDLNRYTSQPAGFTVGGVG
jgi:hypothetical protein